MKAGGSAGHGLVLSCQGAECRPWAHSRGKSWVDGGGAPPAWPSPVTPTLVECEEDEGRGERSPGGKSEETDVRSWNSFFSSSAHSSAPLFSCPLTTEFMSNINV